MPDTQESWTSRTADALANLSGTKDFMADAIEAAFEAAGEMKTVRLKTLLGRCMEVLREHQDCSADVCSLGSPDGLREQIEEAIK